MLEECANCSYCCPFTWLRARRRLVHSWWMSTVAKQHNEWTRRLRACVQVKGQQFLNIYWHIWLWCR